MIQNIRLILVLFFLLSSIQANAGSIQIPLDSIKGKWIYIGRCMGANISQKPLPGKWQFDTFEIKKSKSSKIPKRFNNKNVVEMFRIGYFANSFLSPIYNGKPADSMILYHDNTNSCEEHAVQYYGKRKKGDFLLRRLTADTMHLSFNSSRCKNGKSAIDSSSFIYVKLKPKIGGK